MAARLTSTHLLSGAGGDAKGMQLAGFDPAAAYNHFPAAIASMKANFPDCDARVFDVTEMDMRRMPDTNVLVGSPICTEVSPQGRIPRQQGNQEGRFGRTRATAFALISAVEAHRYEVILGENVLEFVTDWKLFWWWVEGFNLLDYTLQLLSVSAAHIGGPGNALAPQDRDRIIFMFTRNDIDMPKLEPRPTCTCTCCGIVQGVQTYRKPGVIVGRYGIQYDYTCPRCGVRVTPHTVGADTIFDLDDLGDRVGGRLVPSTRARIQDGLDLFGHRQFVVTMRNHVRPRLLSAPLTSVSAGGNHHLLVTPDGGGTVAGCRARIITTREQLRAQRFDDDFIVHGTASERRTQAGNAVPVNLAQWAGEHIRPVLAGRTSAGDVDEWEALAAQLA